jgi:hypothetical protein
LVARTAVHATLREETPRLERQPRRPRTRSRGMEAMVKAVKAMDV